MVFVDARGTLRHGSPKSFLGAGQDSSLTVQWSHAFSRFVRESGKGLPKPFG